MPIPNNVTVSDHISDAFGKMNLAIGNIVSGVTYVPSTNLLSVTKINGESISTEIPTGSNLLINSTDVFTYGAVTNWNAPFTATTFDQVFDYIFGVPVTLDMTVDAGKYIELFIDTTTVQTYVQFAFYSVNIFDRDVDGDSFFIKINSNTSIPTVVSSKTGTVIIENNALYLFTYSTGSASWHHNLVNSGDYTQIINSVNSYTSFLFSGFTNNYINDTSSLNTVSTGLYSRLTMKQAGVYYVNFNNYGTRYEIYLPDATLFPYKTLELIDITIPQYGSPDEYNIKYIYPASGQSIYTVSNNVSLNYLTFNDQTIKYAKFVSNGSNWVLVEPYDLFRTPFTFNYNSLNFYGEAYPNNMYYTATTTDNGSGGIFWIDNNLCHFDFDFQGMVSTLNPFDDISILLPYEVSNDSTKNRGYKNVVLVTSGGTLSMDGSIIWQGGYPRPTILKFIKTYYPFITYYQWNDIGSQNFMIRGSIEYSIYQVNSSIFRMNVTDTDLRLLYTGYYF